jgi:hypothetical protein
MFSHVIVPAHIILPDWVAEWYKLKIGKVFGRRFLLTTKHIDELR